MGWNEDRAALKGYVDRLERSLVELDVPPDTLVSGLAAVVNGRAALHVSEVLTTYMGIVREDVTDPLADALRKFAEQAEELSGALRRLPDS